MTKRTKLPIIWAGLAFMLIIIVLLSLNVGKVTISPSEVWQTFIGNGTFKQELILFDIRLPTIILAILVGSGMAISGSILQSVTRNELADPGILGINSGAGLAVVTYITFFKSPMGDLSIFSTFALPLVAFCGALITSALILYLSWNKGVHTIRLILVGIGLNSGFIAIITAMQLRLNPLDFMKAMVWLSGDLWATQWKYVWALLPWYVILIPFVLYKSHSLNVLNLGSLVSTGLGIRTERERIVLIVVAVALAGLGVSAGGGIAFLGLISPHIARRLVGPRHQAFIPTAAIIGAIILLLADMIGKNLLHIDIPSGIVVSLVSAPYFIYLLMKSK